MTNSLAAETSTPMSLPKALEAILCTGQVQGRTKTIAVAGGSTQNNLWTLSAVLASQGGLRTLEVGFACGLSALVFCDHHLRQAGGMHTAIDPFQADLDEAGLVQIEASGLTGFLRFLPQMSHEALPRLLNEGERFDVIYIDGSHLFEHVFLDLYYSARLLSDNGIVLLDDSTYPDVAKAIAFTRANLENGLREIDLSSFRQDRGASMRYRIAKALGRQQMTAFRRNGPIERHWNAVLKRF
jgi:predicted O-methyltransferase YrrM